MAIYHCSIKIGSRANGQSAIAAAAYRAADKVTDREIGQVSDYTRKGGVVHSEIALCANAPAEYADRETLWNAVHEIEKAKNARLWREIEVALPKELSRADQIAAVREFVGDLVAQGMCADWSLHDKGDGNPHAHIMLTTRSIKENGEWAPKSRKVYDLDAEGNKIFQKVDKTGRKQYKSHKEDYNDWNQTERVEEWRAAWAQCCNARLSAEARIDHRSFKRQGMERQPTIHEGHTARKIEQTGGQSDRCELNRQIARSNAERQDMGAALQQIEKQIQILQEQITRAREGFYVRFRPNRAYAEIFGEELQKHNVKAKWGADKKTGEMVGLVAHEDKEKYYQARQAAIGRYVVGCRDDYIRQEMIFGALRIAKKSGEKQDKMAKAKAWREEFDRKAAVVQQWNEELSHFHLPKKKRELTELRDTAAAELGKVTANLRNHLQVSTMFNGREFDCREADRDLVGITLRRIDTKIEDLQLEVNAERQRNESIQRYADMGITQESVDRAFKAFKNACAVVPEHSREYATEALERAPMKKMLDDLGMFPKVLDEIVKRIEAVLVAANLKRKPEQPPQQQERTQEQPKTQGAYFSREKLKAAEKQVKQREEERRKEQQQDRPQRPKRPRR